MGHIIGGAYGYGDVLANGENYEVNYSGPKANPIVAKYTPVGYGHDQVYGYGKAYGHDLVHGYGYAHGDVLADGQNFEVNYSGPKANPIVAKYTPVGYGYGNAVHNGIVYGHGDAVYGSGDLGYGHEDMVRCTLDTRDMAMPGNCLLLEGLDMLLKASLPDSSTKMP